MEIKKNWQHLLGLSFLSIFMYTSFLYWGLHFTTVITASLLNAVVPILILLFSCIFLKEKITFSKIIAILISFFGVIVLISQGCPVKLLSGLALNKGDLIIFLAVMAWALFSVWYKGYPGKLPPFVFLFVTVCIGSSLIFPAYLCEIIHGHYISLNSSTILGVAYAAIFSSIIAFTCWNFGAKELGPVNAGYFFNLLPVFSTVLAVIFLDENLHIYHIVGITCVFLGIFINARLHAIKKQKPRNLLLDCGGDL